MFSDEKLNSSVPVWAQMGDKPQMAEVLKKFGKYFLLDQIAQGGMAEIFRARMAAVDAGGRLLGIKRIIPSYSQNPEFVTMFRAEIKVTSGFTHPNIVQLYDYGEEEKMLYIAMEYVDGRNLRQLIARFAEMKSSFPVEICVYIMEQAAQGLAYAHSFKDKFSGRNLNIVHRDISPQNLLISYDGAVKVIDFGIAKAVTNMESTRAGVIKGKPSYLSPEQIAGDVLDGRSDLFALGAVLWELLTGRKLFAGDNDFTVLKLIENCTNHVKPPSVHNPKIPPELDAIVLKCLQRDRDDRYAGAEELQRNLHKFLYQFAPEFNPTDLAYYARDLFKNEIVEDRRRLLKLNEKAERLLATLVEQEERAKKHKASEEVEEDTSVGLSKKSDPVVVAHGRANPAKPGIPTLRGAPVGEGEHGPSPRHPSRKRKTEREEDYRMLDFQAREQSKVHLDYSSLARANSPAVVGADEFGRFRNARGGNTSSMTLSRTNTARRSNPLGAILVLLIIALGGGGYWYSQDTSGRSPASGKASATTGSLVISGSPNAVTVHLDGKVVGDSLPLTIPTVPAGKSLKLMVSANGYRRYVGELYVGGGERKQVSVDLVREDSDLAGGAAARQVPQTVQARRISLRINVMPAGFGTQIRINNTLVDVSGVVEVPVDTRLDLVVERDSFRTHRQTLVINSATLQGRSAYPIDVNLEPARFGYVSIKTTPSAEAVLTVDGIEERWSTPVLKRRMPVGSYRVRLVNTVLGMEKEMTFSVNEDRFTNIDERLPVVSDTSRKRAPGSR